MFKIYGIIAISKIELLNFSETERVNIEVKFLPLQSWKFATLFLVIVHKITDERFIYY